MFASFLAYVAELTGKLRVSCKSFAVNNFKYANSKYYAYFFTLRFSLHLAMVRIFRLFIAEVMLKHVGKKLSIQGVARFLRIKLNTSSSNAFRNASNSLLTICPLPGKFNQRARQSQQTET